MIFGGEKQIPDRLSTLVNELAVEVARPLRVPASAELDAPLFRFGTVGCFREITSDGERNSGRVVVLATLLFSGRFAPSIAVAADKLGRSQKSK